jgi:hypothetical protein
VRVLLSTYDSRGGVEPLVALAVRLRSLAGEVVVSAPPDCAARTAEVGVPLVPAGEPVRVLVHGATPPSLNDETSRTLPAGWPTWASAWPTTFGLRPPSHFQQR